MNLDIPKKLNELIEKFNKADSNSLTDSKLKSDFIEPFFQLLGWNFKIDKYSSTNVSEVEKLSKINQYYPEYVFKAFNQNQFYLKIGSINKNPIDTNVEFKSLHMVCWNSNISVGIFTDFETLNIYDLHNKPGTKIKGLLSCKYTDFADKWSNLYKLIGKESVDQGVLKKYKKDTIHSVHYQLANELLSWHASIVKYLISEYPDFSKNEIEITVSRFINRIFFLRFCENLGLEPIHHLKDISENSNIYKSLLIIFEKANEKYNSGLFYFNRESGRKEESLDLLSFKIEIKDSILKDILQYLYKEDSTVNFSILSVSTIALSYEIFINHLNNNSLGNKVTNDYVKKYSASRKISLIEWIIKKTHQDYLEGKKPGKRSSVSTIKILDPCCGAGLYLLKSFDYLLTWHLKEYLKLYFEDASLESQLPIRKIDSNRWQLTWEERNRILANNIFGVDINRVAVESAELILLLKLLEDISPKSIQDQLKLFWQHALPDLKDNLKSGNALIESDIYKLQDFVATNDEQKSTINAFDWQNEFQLFSPLENFDIIICHPPSYFSEFMIQITKPYFKQRYEYFKDFKNSYLLFYEKSLKLLKKNGILGFAVPEDWLANPESFKLLDKHWIKDVYKLSTLQKKIDDIRNFITIIKKNISGETNVYVVKNLNFSKPFKTHHFKTINYLNINYFFGYFEKFLESDLNKKISLNSSPLANFATCYSGYNAYEKGKGLSLEGTEQTKETIKIRPYHSDKKLNEQWKTEIVGRDITRYCLKFTGMRWIKYGTWLAAPRDPEIFTGDRILVHERISIIDGRIESTVCSNEVFHGRDILAIKPNNDSSNIYYLLGILNSKLFNWYYLVNFSTQSDEAFPKLLIANLNSSPIKNITGDSSREKSLNQELISLVKRILELNQKKLEVTSERESITIDKLINNIDKQIDEVIYILYNLTKSEVDIVENSFNM